MIYVVHSFKLYIYIYIYVCVCVCVCMYIYIYIYIYVCVCLYLIQFEQRVLTEFSSAVFVCVIMLFHANPRMPIPESYLLGLYDRSRVRRCDKNWN